MRKRKLVKEITIGLLDYDIKNTPHTAVASSWRLELEFQVVDPEVDDRAYQIKVIISYKLNNKPKLDKSDSEDKLKKMVSSYGGSGNR